MIDTCCAVDNRTNISILMVSFNAEKSIKNAIDSVRRLKRNDVLFYIVDGGSVDNTCNIIKENLDVIDGYISEPDSGIYDAMNKAWQMAPVGGYVIYIGADDTLVELPTKHVLNYMAKEGVSLLYGNVSIEGGIFASKFNWQLRYRNTAHHQGIFLRKIEQEISPFDPSLKIYGDWDLNLRLFMRGIKSSELAFVVCNAGPGGVSSKLLLPEIFNVAKKNGDFLWGVISWLYHKVL